MAPEVSSLVFATKVPKAPWYRLIWAHLFRDLGGKLRRHWLRSLTADDAFHLDTSTYFAWRRERRRRIDHLDAMRRPKPNYNRTKFKF